ncbi:MAG: hypothetical protein QM718_00655 [Steroidobacteraceae bacterium]
MAGLIGVPMAAGAVERAAPNPQVETVIVTGSQDGLDLQRSADSGALGDKSLLDTPFSVTVVDAEEIARTQASSVAQIFFDDPSVLSSSTSATTNWWGAQVRASTGRWGCGCSGDGRALGLC